MKGKTALVIEENRDTRTSLRRALEGHGYFVVCATNGNEALELLERISTPSLILLDSEMPLGESESFLRVVNSNPVYALIPLAQMSLRNSTASLQHLAPHDLEASEFLKALAVGTLR